MADPDRVRRVISTARFATREVNVNSPVNLTGRPADGFPPGWKGRIGGHRVYTTGHSRKIIRADPPVKTRADCSQARPGRDHTRLRLSGPGCGNRRYRLSQPWLPRANASPSIEFKPAVPSRLHASPATAWPSFPARCGTERVRFIPRQSCMEMIGAMRWPWAARLRQAIPSISASRPRQAKAEYGRGPAALGLQSAAFFTGGSALIIFFEDSGIHAMPPIRLSSRAENPSRWPSRFKLTGEFTFTSLVANLAVLITPANPVWVSIPPNWLPCRCLRKK